VPGSVRPRLHPSGNGRVSETPSEQMRGQKDSSSLRAPLASLVVGSTGFFKSAPIQSDKSNKHCADNDHQTEEDRSGDEDGVFHIVGTMD
jgi:hypothetical protein